MTREIEAPRIGRGARNRKTQTVRTPVAKRARSAPSSAAPVVTGVEPRVDLLPQEVYANRRARAVVRRAWLGVGVLALVTALGVGAAVLDQTHAQSELDLTRSESTTLLQQQLRYKDVRTVEGDTRLLQAAQTVGGSTEIDWSDYLTKVQASLPSTVTIGTLSVSSANPTEAFDQAQGPLRGQRIATITFSANSATFPSVPQWLQSVKGLPGFVDANADSVTLSSDSAGYTVDMTIHVGVEAYDGKYAPKEK